MALVSQNFALLLFVAIIVIAAVLAWWLGNYADYDKCSFHTFIAILAGLGIFITFMFYYNLVALQNQQQQLASIQEISKINESMLNSVLNEMKHASNIIPNFVLSITPLTNTVCCSTGGTGSDPTCIIAVGLDPVTPQTCTEKMVLSYRIFSLWQDTIASSILMNYDSAAYVANFLQRANSQQLYSQWQVSRIDFDPHTQQFGDLLFEYGLPITNQTPESYSLAAEQLIADPRYQTI